MATLEAAGTDIKQITPGSQASGKDYMVELVETAQAAHNLSDMRAQISAHIKQTENTAATVLPAMVHESGPARGK